MCKQIDHFPEETDYEADPSEYFLRKYIVSSGEIILYVPFYCSNVLKVTTRKHHIMLFSLKVFLPFALSHWSAVLVTDLGLCVTAVSACF